MWEDFSLSLEMTNYHEICPAENLCYEKDSLAIMDFLVIPKYFFIENVIEKRKPLNDTARRAGWTGYNIVMASIPDFGKIFYIKRLM